LSEATRLQRLVQTVVLLIIFTDLATGGVRAHVKAASRQAKPQSVAPVVTLHMPAPERFELALDEIELDVSRAAADRKAPGSRPSIVPSARLRRMAGTSATFDVDASTTAELTSLARRLEDANPGARAQLVMYEERSGRSESTRRLLTREVILVLDDDADPSRVLEDADVSPPKPVPGVPRSYVVEAGDPLSAVSVANSLRERPGVRYAYPLVKRRWFPR
jgi:hypothetical protein